MELHNMPWVGETTPPDTILGMRRASAKRKSLLSSENADSRRPSELRSEGMAFKRESILGTSTGSFIGSHSKVQLAALRMFP